MKQERYLAPHPKIWFEFLGWITTLSTLNILSEKTDSIYIKAIYYFSFFVFFSNLEKNLLTAKYQKYLPSKFSPRIKSMFTYCVMCIVFGLTYFFIIKVVESLVEVFKL